MATENRWDDVPVETEGHECLFHSAGDVCREARSKQGRVGFIQVGVGKTKGCPWIMGNEEWKRWGLQTVKESVMGGVAEQQWSLNKQAGGTGLRGLLGEPGVTVGSKETGH
jgi:hypothetical protein